MKHQDLQHRPTGVGRAVAGQGQRSPRVEEGLALVAMVVGFVAVVGLFLLPYVVKGYHYPVTWGAATYVAKARSAGHDGLALLGLIRVGGSLLVAVLMHATGQNAFTLVAIMPPVLAALVGLGVAAVLRVAFDIRPMWVPIVALMTWVAFIQNELMDFHFDNLVTAVFILAGFAAVLAWASRGKGAMMVMVFFVAAGISHWPFYIFAMVILVVAISLFVWVPIGAAWSGWRARLRRAFPILIVALASGAFVGPSLLWRPPTGWFGVKLGSIASRLRRRFLFAVGQQHTLYALPVAAIGMGAAIAETRGTRGGDGRRLFLCLMASWIVVSVTAVLGQVAGIPTAGARVISFFFPLPILGFLALWRLGRWRARRVPGRAGSIAVAVMIVAVVVALSALTEGWWKGREPWIHEEAVQQVMSAGRYLDQVAPDSQAIFLVKGGLQWWIIQASLPPDQLDRVFPYFGPVNSFLAGFPKRGYRLRFGPDPGSLRPNPIGILIERLNPSKFRSRSRQFPGGLVAPGVLILRGPVPSSSIAQQDPPTANVGILGSTWVPALVLVILLLVGGGWAIAALPGDPVLRATLAPAVGAAVAVLSALGWGIARLPFTGLFPLIPVVLASAVGWALGWRILHPAGGRNEEATPWIADGS